MEEIIRRKRDGEALTTEQIDRVVAGSVSGGLPDYQLAALLMAICLKGMTPHETADLTAAMLRSGRTLDLDGIPGPKIDKHSTGGVGDKVSLVLAPLVAAAGLRVPMVCGRALGHTGGTIDKVESIPGFRTDLDESRIRRIVAEVGAVIVGPTTWLAPADRKWYALRDVTATVESIPLITSSILSKKLAEGISGVVFDVKVGSGAFMKTLPQARCLARSLVGSCRRMERAAVALLTAMDQPLGYALGNALEVTEAIGALHGKGPEDLERLTLELGAWMLRLAGAERNLERGRRILRDLLHGGAAADKFAEMVRAQGGDPQVVQDPARLPTARVREEVFGPASGYVTRIAADEIGCAALALGAGRDRAEDAVDLVAGIVLLKKVGDPVRRGEPVAVLHSGDPARIQAGRQRVLAAFRTGPRRSRKTDPVLERWEKG